MRILLMADTPPNPDSGAAGTEYQTVAALRRLGNEVDTVWADELSHRIRHGNLHYLLELPRAYRNAMLAKMRLKRYDVIHVNQPHGYLAAKTLRSNGDKAVFVHRSHGFEPRARDVLSGWQRLYSRKRPFANRVASMAMEKLLEINNSAIARYADGHIVSASLCADYLNTEYGVVKDRIAVIHQAPPGLYQETPARTFFPEQLNRLLYVGQLAFFKAPMVLAAAFEKILARHPESTLTWVCDARHHRDAAALFSETARGRITFLDWAPQAQLLEIYDSHGIFLFPSFFEGFGKAFIEAMARGLVVVVSAEGGANDLIKHEQNGLLTRVGDADAIATACAKVQSDPQFAKRLGMQARETAMSYTWDRVARETTAFYSRLQGLKATTR